MTITAVALPAENIVAVPVSIPQSMSALAALPVTGGASGYMHEQSTPSAQWAIVIPDQGRFPNVQIYLTTGELILTDLVVTNTLVTITFATATAGFAVIT